MSIKVGDYLFEGSYMAPGDLSNKPGLFLVTEFLKGRHHILDIGESVEVRKAVEFHERRDCWLQKSQKYELRVSVLYTPDLTAAQRMTLERELRARLSPPCGNPALSKPKSLKKRKSVKSKRLLKKRPVKRGK
jgi:hypothetical protein